MRNDKDLNKLIRYLAYVLELLVLFMLQETPGLLPSIFGARPVLLFPAVVAIAMLEPSARLLFGVVGGLFCDFGLSGMLGFHALVLGVLCFFISLVIRTYLQNNMATAILTGCGAWAWWCWPSGSFCISSNIPIRPMPLPTTTCQSIFTPFCSFPWLYLLNRGLSQALGRAGEGDPVMREDNLPGKGGPPFENAQAGKDRPFRRLHPVGAGGVCGL